MKASTYNPSCINKLIEGQKSKGVKKQVSYTSDPLDSRLYSNRGLSYTERQRAIEHNLRFA